MPSKITLTRITDGDHATAMNANMDILETEFCNVLSLDGSAPNALTAPLDMNSEFIINMPAGVAPTHPLQKQQIEGLIDAAAGIGGNLNDLLDVNVPSPADGQALVYDNATSMWIAGQSGPTGTVDLAVLRYDLAGGNFVEVPEVRIQSGGTIEIDHEGIIQALDSVGTARAALTTDERQPAPPGSTGGTPPAPDPNIGSVSLLMTGETSDIGLAGGSSSFGPLVPEIGPSFEWERYAGSTTATDGGVVNDITLPAGSSRVIYGLEESGIPNAGWDQVSATNIANFGSSDFTVECDFYFGPNSSGNGTLIGKWLFGQRCWTIALDASNRVSISISAFGSDNIALHQQEGLAGGSAAIPSGQWVRLAFQRSGNDYTLWLDGDRSQDGVITNSTTLFNSTSEVHFCGADQPETGTGNQEIYMTNIRITEGVARYTSGAATITQDTAPFAGSETVEALVIGDDTENTTTILENVVNPIFKENVVIRDTIQGSGNPTSSNAFQGKVIYRNKDSTTLLGSVGFDGSDSSLDIRNLVRSGNVVLCATDASNNLRCGVNVNADLTTNLNHPITNEVVLQTIAASAGGVEVVNNLTGSGAERVLTESDLGGAGGGTTDGAILVYDTGTGTWIENPAIIFDQSDTDVVCTIDGSQLDGSGDDIFQINNMQPAGTVMDITPSGNSSYRLWIARDQTGSNWFSLEHQYGLSTPNHELILESSEGSVFFEAENEGNFHLGGGESNAPIHIFTTTADNQVRIDQTATLMLEDRAAASTDQVGHGQLYVLNDGFLYYKYNGVAAVRLDTSGVTFPLDLADNEQIRFGTGNDVTMEYTGTNFELNNTDVGAIQFIGSPVHVRGGEVFAIFDSTNNDNVNFAHDGTDLQVGATGTGAIIIDGVNLRLEDGDELQFGNTNDAAMEWDNGSSTLQTLVAGTGDWEVLLNTTETAILAEANEAVTLYYDGVSCLRTRVDASTNLTRGQVKHSDGNFYDVGLAKMVILEQDANLTLGNAQNQKLIHKDSGGAVTYTVTNDSNIQTGTVWTVVNEDTENLTIAEDTGVTLRHFDGSTSGGATGNRTLASGGVCTIVKYLNTEYFIWGTGLS